MLLAVCGVLAGCGHRIAPPAALGPIAVGERPIRPVPAFGSVWIANAAAGTVIRVDAVTGAIAATITVADPARLLAAGCAPSSEHASATGSFGLRACDAPSAVAAGGRSIWTTANDTNAIARIDPARNVVSGTARVGFDPWAVLASEEAVWASDYTGDTIVRIDPESLEVRARIPVASGPTEMAVTRDALWVVSSAAGVVSRIDSRTNAVAATIPVSAWALSISIWGDDVWVRGGSNRGDGGLSRIDARTNAVVARFEAGAPQGREGVASIAATDRGVWVPGVSLDLIDRAGAVAVSAPISSYSVAFDGKFLWILDVFGRLVRHPVGP